MGAIIGGLTLLVLGAGIYFVLKGFVWFILAFAWVFLIVAAVVDYKVIINFGKRLIDLFKKNPLYGVGAIGLSAVFYPLLFFILMMRSLLSRFVKKIGFDIPGQAAFQQEKEEFVEYEEVDDAVLELEEIELLKRENRR